MFYCHGWPACRLEAGLIDALPIRLIAIDRPGSGESTDLPGRTLLDVAGDVAVVADQLGIERFHLIGMSGGGPFAAATAFALPRRVLGLALINPVPPGHTSGLDESGVAELFRLGRHPHWARYLLGAVRMALRLGLTTPERIIGAGLPACDRAVLTEAALGRLGEVWREAVRHGVDGPVTDAAVLAAPWGFDPSGITVPTTVWSGAEDTIVPCDSARGYADIPGVRRVVEPGEGHYSLPLRHAARIMGELVAGSGR